jgi:hypothetical protein
MIRYFFAASWLVMLYFLVDSRDQIGRLEEELAQVQESAAKPDVPAKKTVRIIKPNQPRSKLFGFLYEINKNGKKIHYRPGVLTVDDHSLGKDDRFLDLLDLLYEQEKLQMIEIPKSVEIQDDLKIAGFGEDFVQVASDSVWKIRFRE